MVKRANGIKNVRLVIVVATLVVLGTVAAVLPAAAQTPIDVRVQVSATQEYPFRDPQYSLRITGTTQGLPPGVTVAGRVECDEVYADSSRSTKIPFYGPDLATPLDAGVWYFVPNSCTPVDADPVRLVGPGGPYRIILQGGPYARSQFQSRVETFALVSHVDSDPNRPVVTLVAEVLGVDSSSMRGLEVFFDWEYSTGGSTCSSSECRPAGDFAVVEGCSATTTAPPDKPWLAAATCVLEGQRAKDLLAGTGAYTAYWKGNRNFRASGAPGRVVEATGDPTLAGRLLTSLYSTEPVQIAPTYVPPGCTREPAAQASLSTALVGNMDCKTLAIAKLLTGIAFVVVLSGAGAGAPIAVVKIAQISNIVGFIAEAGYVAVGATYAKQVALLAYSIAITAANVGGNVALYGHVFERPAT